MENDREFRVYILTPCDLYLYSSCPTGHIAHVDHSVS